MIVQLYDAYGHVVNTGSDNGWWADQTKPLHGTYLSSVSDLEFSQFLVKMLDAMLTEFIDAYTGMKW